MRLSSRATFACLLAVVIASSRATTLALTQADSATVASAKATGMRYQSSSTWPRTLAGLVHELKVEPGTTGA